MALFEFKLKPIEKTQAFAEAPDFELHWYGLTDGYYWMEIGQECLFRYTPEIMASWNNEDNNIEAPEPYTDYYVVRLYEDILAILPHILQPIPADIHGYISSAEKQAFWHSKIWNIYECADDGKVEDFCLQAIEWWESRQLDTGHLQKGPQIWMWRFEDTIYIRWDNTAINNSGIPHWSANTGEIKLPVSDFINEVEGFHHRLMESMDKRIETLNKSNPIAHVNIDMPSLRAEHKGRIESLAKVLETSPVSKNWNDVISVNRKLMKIENSVS